VVSLAGVRRVERWRPWAVIFVVALAVRLLIVAFFARAPVNDLLWNDSVGWNLATGNGFTASPAPPYVPGIFRSPGYPFFLAVTYGVAGHHYTPVFVVQAVLDAGTAILIGAIAGLLGGRRLGLVAAGLYALYVYPAIFCGILHQDILLVFCTTVALLLTVRALSGEPSVKRWVGVGVVLGVAALVKPILVLLGAVPALSALMQLGLRAALQVTLVVGLAGFATISPWLVRNYVVFRAVPPLAVGGTGDDLVLLLREIEEGEEAVVGRAMAAQPSRDSRHYLESFLDGQALIEHQHELAESAWPGIKRRWPAYVALILKNVPRLWLSKHAMAHGEVVALVGRVVSYVFLGAGLLGMWVLVPRWRHYLPLYLTIVVVTLGYAWHLVEARYSLPARPAMCVFIGALVLALWDRRRPQAE
jgi:4-amino-4-deoxy-L-arabinose transferase-like glycosyltransferase